MSIVDAEGNQTGYLADASQCAEIMHSMQSEIADLTKKLAAHLIPEQIIVNSLAPGAFPSEMNKAARDHADEVGKGIPARRVGRPEDIAAGALYLASRAGDYVIGHTLNVDGGLVSAEMGGSIDA